MDLHQTDRAMIGQLPAHNQQFSDHYYGKIPFVISDILEEVEE